MTRRDNLTRFLGALLIVLGIASFIVLAAALSPMDGFPPILFVPLFFIVAGAFIANRAES
jgi:hypothetical protein